MKRTPLRRRKALVWRPKKTAYARRVRDVDYMRSVRGLPCMLSGVARAGVCNGDVEADHAGDRGVGQKADDKTCIPMCRKHHRDRTDGRGFFRGLELAEQRRWRRWAIGQTQLLIAEKRVGVCRPKEEGDACDV